MNHTRCPHDRPLAARVPGLLHSRRRPERAHRGSQPAHQENRAIGTRIPQLLQLSAPLTAALQHRLATIRVARSEGAYHVQQRRVIKPCLATLVTSGATASDPP